MSVTKTELLKRMLESKTSVNSSLAFFIDEITDSLINLTKHNRVSWFPFSVFSDHNSFIPKKLQSIIDKQMEEGLVLSRENSYYTEQNGNYFFSVCYKRIGTDRMTSGFIVTSSSDGGKNGAGIVNSERAMRLYNLIRYNTNAKKATDEEEQVNYLRSVYESLKNEQLV